MTFKGGSHGSALQIIPEDKAKDMASKSPDVPNSPSNHFENFLKASKGEETCRSSFAVAGPLCQVMALGVWRNASIQDWFSTVRPNRLPVIKSAINC